MLFSNFICLLYLMVLIDSYTISKGIENDNKIDAIFESLNDYESLPQRRRHHDKFYHKHTRNKLEDTTNPMRKPDKLRDATKYVDKTTTVNTPKLHLKPAHKSTKRRFGGFWKKFKIKAGHENLDRNNRLKKNQAKSSTTQAKSNLNAYPKESYRRELPGIKKSVEESSFVKKRCAKSSENLETSIESPILRDDRVDQTINKLQTANNDKYSIYNTVLFRPYKSEADDSKRILSSIAPKSQTEVTYNVSSDNNYDNPKFTNLAEYDSGTYKNSEPSEQTDERKYSDTAQIEAMLHSVKDKAMVKNASNGTKFEANLILNNTGKRNPAYAQNAYFAMKDIYYTKRSANFAEPNEIGNSTECHDLAARSIKEGAMTMALNVEDKLEKEVKSIYKKVKNKVSKDNHKEKPTIKQTMRSPEKPASTTKKKIEVDKSKTKPTPKAIPKPTKTKPLKKNNTDNIFVKGDMLTKEGTAVLTMDSYAMLTLCEQMLAKTHENDLMTMYTITDKIDRFKRKDFQTTKSHSVSLSDQIVNVNAYDDVYQAPESYDYSMPVSIPDLSTIPDWNDIKDEKNESVDNENMEEKEEKKHFIKEQNTDGVDDNTNALTKIRNEDDSSGTVEGTTSQLSSASPSSDHSTLEYTTLSDLANKLSYNEYVDGYKYYLNFQKEQGKQNFSNLVKYQAHRHHSVDDIGKYILKKIPQIPQPDTRRKRFFDDSDIDYQDISTRSDDSWFKKHFFMFLDNGPPKKYHNSQTVTLKSPMTQNIKDGIETEKYFTNIDNSRIDSSEDTQEAEINLDELAKTLSNNKLSSIHYAKEPTTVSYILQVSEDDKPKEIVKVLYPNLINKLFGKARRTLSSQNAINIDKTGDLHRITATDSHKRDGVLLEKDLGRAKRNAKKMSTTKNKQSSEQTTVKCTSLLMLSDKKHGNVNVDLSFHSTSGKTTEKGDFIKDILNKLHFGKHKNSTVKKVKRENRVERYNPFKKFRDLFKGKTEDSTPKRKINGPGYATLDLPLDTFKPVKHNKMMTVEEMKKQIPNITYDITSTYFNNDAYEEEKNSKPDTTNVETEEDMQILKKTLRKTEPFPTYTSIYPVHKKSNIRNHKKPKSTTKSVLNFFHDDDLLNNMDTLAIVADTVDSVFTTTTHMTIDDMKKEINDMQVKISGEDSDNLPNRMPHTCFNDKRIEPKYEIYTIDPIIARSTLPHEVVNRVVNDNTLLSVHNKTNDKKKVQSDLKTKQKHTETIQIKPKTMKTQCKSKSGSGSEAKEKDYINDLLSWDKDLTTINPKPMKLDMKSYNSSGIEQKLKNDFYDELLKWNKEMINVPSRNLFPQKDYTTPDIEKLNKELAEVTESIKQYKPVETPIQSWTMGPGRINMSPRKLYNKQIDNIVIEENVFRINKNLKKPNSFGALLHRVNNFKTTRFSKNRGDDATTVKEDRINVTPSMIYFDTTLLSYDDDVDYMTSKLIQKKRTRSPLNEEHKLGSGLTITRYNKQPVQYFSTPLPMRMNDFEKFLKENDLDPASVTKPLAPFPEDLPQKLSDSIIDSPAKLLKTSHNKELNFEKIQSQFRTIQKTPKTVTINNLERDSDEFNYLDQLQSELYINYDEKKRFKRYDEISSDGDDFVKGSYKDGSRDRTLEKIKLEDKYGVYENKSSVTLNNDLNDNTDHENFPQKDFEVAIINFDDINQELSNNTRPSSLSRFHVRLNENNPNKYTLTYPESYPMKLEVTTSRTTNDLATEMQPIRNFERGAKNKKFVNKLHNDLLYNHGITHEPTTLSPKAEDSLLKKLLLPSYAGYSHWTTTYGTPCVFSEMPVKNDSKPKSVQISGHSYRYEIIFHQPNKKEYPLMPSLAKATEKAKFVEELKRPSLNSSTTRPQTAEIIRVDLPTYYLPDMSTAAPVTEAIRTWNERVLSFIPKFKATNIDITRNHLGSRYKNFLIEIRSNLEPRVNDAATESSETTQENEIANDYNIDELLKIITPVYLEYGLMKPKAIIKESAVQKRELSASNVYTAKDVAALEVIVDLIKNVANTKESDTYTFNSISKSAQTQVTPLATEKPENQLNSIQVHIAIPCDTNTDKKRSLEPVRVRKVFSANLSSPVDIKYRVNSFEKTPATLVTPYNSLSPGVYLVVDNSYLPSGLSLKPIGNEVLNANVKGAQYATVTQKIVTESSTKGFVKVTLSKDLVSAINNYLEHYNNLTESTKLCRNIKFPRKAKTSHNRPKRGLNWDRIKKYFGHDRVCHCKCKANKTMCSACAASDAVIGELIFEFDNLAKYMNDHCTEIQTFFWMNPSGGKKLRDSVHKIDTSLRDYYKRVKGKCQGRTCKTFTTYIDKRELESQNKVDENAGLHFINDLDAMANETEEVSQIVTCFDTELRQKREKLVNTINRCIFSKHHNTSPSDYKAKPVVENVYSLDKVNVNIICNTDSATSPSNPILDNFMNLNISGHIDLEDKCTSKKTQRKKKLKDLFFSKKKVLENRIVDKELNKLKINKRELQDEQNDIPLLADSGGTFWNDYINRRSIGPKIEKVKEPDLKISVIQTQNLVKVSETPIRNINNSSPNLNMKVYTTPINVKLHESSLSNIDGFFKISDYVKVTDKAEYQTTKKKLLKHKTTDDINKYNAIQSKKINKLLTINYILPNNKTTKKTTKKPKFVVHPKYKFRNTTNRICNRGITKTITQSIPEINESTVPNSFDDLEVVTLKVSFDLDNDNLITDIIDNKRYTTTITNNNTTEFKSSQILYSEFNINTISNATTETNPTIVIVNDYNDIPEKYKGLLLSIIEYETNKLNNEWLKYAFVRSVDNDTALKYTNKFGYDSKSIQTKDSFSPNSINTKYNIDVTTDRITKNSKVTQSKTSDDIKESRVGLLKKILDKLSRTAKYEQKNKVATKMTTSETNSIFRMKGPNKKQDRSPIEASDSCFMQRRLCDLSATSKHVFTIYKRLKRSNFENYIRNISCHKYKSAPKSILIKKKKIKTIYGVTQRNYKRYKRFETRHVSEKDLKNIKNLQKIITNKPKLHAKVLSMEATDGFEMFYKGDDNIYRIKKRNRRNVIFNNTARELKNLPSIPMGLNEIKVLAGDAVTLKCFEGNHAMGRDKQYTWAAEKQDMTGQDNVAMKNSALIIRDVQPKNGGVYTCTENSILRRNLKVSVFTLPTFKVIRSADYLMNCSCDEQDTNALQSLGSALSDVACFGECVTLTKKPECLRDDDNGKAYIGVTVAMILHPGPRVKCSVSCRRDIRAAMASLLLENVEALDYVPVVLLENGVEKTLIPTKNGAAPSFAKDESKNPRVNHVHSPHTSLVLSCPAGYKLLEDLKICAARPTNARDRDNKRFGSPRGSSYGAEAERHRKLRERPRRYDWWWYPPCGFCVACGVVLCCCGVCLALAFLIHVTSRGCTLRDKEKPEGKKVHQGTGHGHAKKQPQSPSRIILSKLFKSSLTTSWATESQETKHELWKEKKLPPPLPPVDFDS